MSQRATGFAKKPPAARTERVGNPARSGSGAAQRAIPLKLAPLLAPYKKHGRLSLRIERMPQLARLSAGRNNGNNSWSLALDELEDLTYLPPEHNHEPHTLAIRIIALEEDGSTLALIDHIVSPDAHVGEPDARDEDYLRQLSEELGKVKAALAVREAELERRKHERADPGPLREAIDAELTSGRAAWKLELDQRLAAAAAEAAAALEVHKKAWQEEHNARVTQSEERTQAPIVEARERWRQEAKTALVKAENSWRAEEASRFAAAEAQWRTKLAAAEAAAKNSPDTGAELQRSRNEIVELQAKLASAEAKARVKPEADPELQRARIELVALRSRLQESERALSEAQSAAAAALARAQQDAATALGKSESDWKSREAQRLAAAQMSWREESDRALAEVASRCERAEVSLARVQQEQLAAKADPASSGELRTLRDDLSTARTQLAERDSALDVLRGQLAADQAEPGDAGELQVLRDDLSAARTQLAERDSALDVLRGQLAAAQADKSGHEALQLALAAAKADLSRRDAELVAAREAEAVAQAAFVSEREGLQRALAEAKSENSGRDAKLTQLPAEAVSPDIGREIDAAVERARLAWKVDEDRRLADAEAQWSEEAAAIQMEARSRYESAEAALALLRMRSERERNDENGDPLLRDRFAALEAALTTRESELAYARSMLETHGLLTPGSDLQNLARRTGQQVKELAPRGIAGGSRLVIELSLAAALAVAAFVFLPRAMTLMPDTWQQNIDNTMTEVRVAFGGSYPPASTPAPRRVTAAPRPVVVVHAANLREAPSGKGAVTATLPRGTSVFVAEQKGNWTHVTIGDGKQQGWIYTAYLQTGVETSKAPRKKRRTRH